MPENRKLKVFLCHSKDDKPKVRELYHRLAANGFDAWLDEEKLMPGQDWDLEIRKAVRKSDVVVVCLSNSSTTKAGYVQKEIRFALDIAEEQPEGIVFIIPAKLDDCEVPSRLNKWHWVNLYEKKGYGQLEASLKLRAKALELIWYQPFDFEPQMVKIPAGKFLMGSTDEQIAQAVKNGADKHWIKNEKPQHEIELPDYLIGIYPVTNREYQAFIYNTNYKPPHGWDGNRYPAEKGEYPVVNVSWNDAIAYCEWLNKKSGKQYRLPTEAEWEKAARGNDSRIYPWGWDFDSKKSNTKESNLGSTSDVGRFSPQGNSPHNCADMVGNVWEWCSDWFNENEYSERMNKNIKNPQGPPMGSSRVIRGGSFINSLIEARCANRNGLSPNETSYGIGFRISSSLITEEN